MGYKEALMRVLGDKCSCGRTEGLALYFKEEDPIIACDVCAKENGLELKVENVCDAHVTQNNQVTVTAPVRDKLNIEPGDLVFFEILRVISPEGIEKYTGGKKLCQA